MKTMTTINGTIRNGVRSGNGVVFADLYTDSGEKYDLIAFNRAPKAQEIIRSAANADIEVTVTGELTHRDRGPGIYVNTVFLGLEQQKELEPSSTITKEELTAMHWRDRNAWRWNMYQQSNNLNYLLVDDDLLLTL